MRKPDFDAFFAARLEEVAKEGRYRRFADIERIRGRFPRALYRAGAGAPPVEVTVWCSNDYLGMGQHPAVLAAMEAALRQTGAGAGGTRNISGTTHEIVLLEERLARWHGKEAALTFTSGYVANEAALYALARHLPDPLVFSDANNHASMIAGIRNSRAECRIFRHNDVDHLAALLAAAEPRRSKIIALESLYSMEGDIAPLAAICDLAERHGAFLYLDEVHAVGLYGENGAGIALRDRVTERIDLVQGTLGKAVGLIGGYVAGSARLIDFVRHHAPGFIFTTALPPAIAAGALASIGILSEANDLRARHRQRADMLRAALRQRSLPVLGDDSHIVPVMVGEARLCQEIARRLLERHRLYVQPINYPTVPRGAERLRLTPSPLHEEGDVAVFADALAASWPGERLSSVA